MNSLELYRKYYGFEIIPPETLPSNKQNHIKKNIPIMKDGVQVGTCNINMLTGTIDITDLEQSLLDDLNKPKYKSFSIMDEEATDEC